MNFIKKISQFIQNDLWRKTGEELSKWKRILFLALRSIILTIRGFLDNDLNIRANALTYSMMFALVPILAVLLAISKGFGFEAVLEDYLNNSFLGTMDLVPTIMGFVERYLETAQGGAFLGIGLLILLWSVYSFFQNIESCFNTIWQVKKSRSYIQQLTTYIAILLLIPILFVVSSGLSIFINTTMTALAPSQPLSALNNFLLKLSPYVICWLIFSWMYWAIPNTKVGAWAAFIPGVLVGTLFQLLQMLSVYLFIFLSRTSIVYGAFAAIPLVLTWLQLSCLFMLSGAELSFSIQNNQEFDYQNDLDHISRRYKDFITLFITWNIVRTFVDNKEPLTATKIITDNRLPARLVNQLLSRLVETNIIREVYAENNEEKGFTPAIDPHQLTVAKVVENIEKQGKEQFLEKPTEELQIFWDKYLLLKKNNTNLNETLVLDIIEKNDIDGVLHRQSEKEK